MQPKESEGAPMTAVKERPILFSAPMVRAILSGAKTQTRRVVRDQPPAHMNSAVPYLKPDDGPQQWCFTGPQLDATGKPLSIEQWEGGWPDCSPAFVCPYGVPGDRLYVKEATWQWCRKSPNGKTKTGRQKYSYRLHGTVATGSVIYVADHSQKPERASYAEPNMAWHYKHARFMQKHLSRITLELADVRVQRVQEISCADAIAEGIHPTANSMTIDCDTESPRDGFRSLWDSINADRGSGWDINPWVFALTFRRLP